MFLPDINVWLALAFDSHLHHRAAQNWFDALSEQVCFFCRMTQQGFLRLATDANIVGKRAVTLPRAWRMYDDYLSDARVAFAAEPDSIETHWRAWTQRRSRSPKIWNDAYLAAFARAAQLQVVTFDKGFAQFKDLNCLILA